MAEVVENTENTENETPAVPQMSTVERAEMLLKQDATIREIHHRVKNNLQTVAALLRLQSRRMSSPEGRDARRGAPQPLAADVGGDALVEHGGDVLAPPDAVAHVRRGEVLQRGVRQRRDAPFESLRRFAAPRVDVNRVFEDLFVLLPSREARDLVAAPSGSKTAPPTRSFP